MEYPPCERGMGIHLFFSPHSDDESLRFDARRPSFTVWEPRLKPSDSFRSRRGRPRRIACASPACASREGWEGGPGVGGWGFGTGEATAETASDETRQCFKTDESCSTKKPTAS